MMVDSNARTDEPCPPNYYHVGSAADPGYYDSMRSAMSGSIHWQHGRVKSY